MVKNIARTQSGIRVLRVLKQLSLIAAAIVLAAVTWTPAAAGNPTQTRQEITGWDDVTPTARFRGVGDWLVDLGQLRSSEVYGPFRTRLYHVGETERFYALDFGNEGTPRTLTAHLLLVTDHAYWWFEDGTDVDQTAVEKAGKFFETQIYPLDHQVFGNEWNPGIDGDPRLFILHQKTIGGYAVGVFSSRDECPRTLCRGSNQHEMIYVGLDYGPPNSPQELTVIAHELQHLIHYNQGGEARWLDEGLAQLAEHLNGFNPRNIAGANLRDFLNNPNIQLDSWPLKLEDDPSINYAMSYIFCVYLYQRFGIPLIQHIAESPFKGLAAIDEALRALKTGETLDQVFTDWAITNYVNSPYAANGQYYYQSLKLPQGASTSPLALKKTYQASVSEYGSDYLAIVGSGSHTLTFQGAAVVPLTNVHPKSGRWMWWSYNEENGAARLQREFDLTNARKPQLTYNAWWDIPNRFSWADVLVSEDGQHWEPVQATHAQPCRPLGNIPCYSGTSKTWQRETIDLSSYAGKKVQIRFEYVTEGAAEGEGLYLDDITLSAIGFSDTAETLDKSWERQGFMRVTGQLPQAWAVNVITRSNPPKVLPVKLDAQNVGKLQFTTPSTGAVIVIAAMAPFVSTSADYTITVR